MPGAIFTPIELSSGPGSQGCKCSCKQLAARITQLEEKIQFMMEKQQQSTPKAPRFTPSGSAQKGDHIQKGKMTDALYGKFYGGKFAVIDSYSS